MNKVLLVLLLVMSQTSFAQEKWRTLTLTNTSGSTINGELMSITSANLSYELNKNWAIESWTGFSYNFRKDLGWLSNQTTVNKLQGSFKIGAGIMYNSGFVNIIESPTNQVFGVITISKRFKL